MNIWILNGTLVLDLFLFDSKSRVSEQKNCKCKVNTPTAHWLWQPQLRRSIIFICKLQNLQTSLELQWESYLL